MKCSQLMFYLIIKMTLILLFSEIFTVPKATFIIMNSFKAGFRSKFFGQKIVEMLTICWIFFFKYFLKDFKIFIREHKTYFVCCRDGSLSYTGSIALTWSEYRIALLKPEIVILTFVRCIGKFIKKNVNLYDSFFLMWKKYCFSL